MDSRIKMVLALHPCHRYRMVSILVLMDSRIKIEHFPRKEDLRPDVSILVLMDSRIKISSWIRYLVKIR